MWLRKRFDFIPRSIVPFEDDSNFVDKEIIEEMKQIAERNIRSGVGDSQDKSIKLTYDTQSITYKLLKKKKLIRNAIDEEMCKEIGVHEISKMIHHYITKPLTYDEVDSFRNKMQKLAMFQFTTNSPEYILDSISIEDSRSSTRRKLLQKCFKAASPRVQRKGMGSPLNNKSQISMTRSINQKIQINNLTQKGGQSPRTSKNTSSITLKGQYLKQLQTVLKSHLNQKQEPRNTRKKSSPSKSPEMKQNKSNIERKKLININPRLQSGSSNHGSYSPSKNSPLVSKKLVIKPNPFIPRKNESSNSLDVEKIEDPPEPVPSQGGQNTQCSTISNLELAIPVSSHFQRSYEPLMRKKPKEIESKRSSSPKTPVNQTFEKNLLKPIKKLPMQGSGFVESHKEPPQHIPTSFTPRNEFKDTLNLYNRISKERALLMNDKSSKCLKKKVEMIKTPGKEVCKSILTLNISSTKAEYYPNNKISTSFTFFQPANNINS